MIDHCAPELAENWQNAPWAPKVLEGILSSVLERWLSGHEDRARLRQWLETTPAQRWIRLEGVRAWREELSSARREDATRAIELLVEPATAALRQDQYLLERCLLSWENLPARYIEPMIPAWLRLLEMLTKESDKAKISAITLNAVLRKGKAELSPLAEATFTTVHQECLAESQHGWLIRKFAELFFRDDDWDRAGQLREKFARVWVEERWPPLSLLRTARADSDLFYDLARRAREQDGGKKALRQLWRAVQAETDAPEAWKEMILRLPRDVRGDM